MRDKSEAAGWVWGGDDYGGVVDADGQYAEARARAEGPPDPDPPPAECSCDPCESPARGAPGIAHCAACCSGSLIEAYDHECVVPDHREMAAAQFGTPA